MPTYITLVKWTDQGRANVKSLPERVAETAKRFEAQGTKIVSNFVTMGRFDQVAVIEAPDDETVAKLAIEVAGRGNAITETLRCFSMDEVKNLV
jgi:uncharacterized protein with GYD domain